MRYANAAHPLKGKQQKPVNLQSERKTNNRAIIPVERSSRLSCQDSTAGYPR